MGKIGMTMQLMNSEYGEMIFNHLEREYKAEISEPFFNHPDDQRNRIVHFFVEAPGLPKGNRMFCFEIEELVPLVCVVKLVT